MESRLERPTLTEEVQELRKAPRNHGLIKLRRAGFNTLWCPVPKVYFPHNSSTVRMLAVTTVN